jgi:hypothetical protein
VIVSIEPWWSATPWATQEGGLVVSLNPRTRFWQSHGRLKMSAQMAPSAPRVVSSSRCDDCRGTTTVQRITPSRPGTSIGRCAAQAAASSIKCKLHRARRNPNLSIGLTAICTHRNEARMRNRNKVVFLTADHLEGQADARASEAKQLPEGEARQNALRNAAQLRMYASMKRALTPQLPNRNSRRGSEG